MGAVETGTLNHTRLMVKDLGATARNLAMMILAAVALACASTLPARAQTTAAEPPEPLPTVELPPALNRVLRDYEAVWSARDAAGLAALFAEDGFVLSGSRPPIRGRAEIETHYQGKGGPLSLRALAWATEGPVGYIIGAYAREAGQADVGKFTLTLRRDADGRWLIFSDMDNGNTRREPAGVAPAQEEGTP